MADPQTGPRDPDRDDELVVTDRRGASPRTVYLVLGVLVVVGLLVWAATALIGS